MERKRIHAKQSGKVLNQGISASLYGSAMTQTTYARLRDLANTMLQAGYPVVVDATFLEAAQRESFSQLAHDCDVPVVILDVWAPKDVLAKRIACRAGQRTDASDATIEVMEVQTEKEEPLTEAERFFTIRVDSTDFQGVQSTINSLVRGRG
ncbi:MAG TPA: hypothetical protein DD706_10145 [Nitrospiraceae bacterium]|nr:hypothetical protein [Nitrospiraceae bacterium]